MARSVSPKQDEHASGRVWSSDEETLSDCLTFFPSGLSQASLTYAIVFLFVFYACVCVCARSRNEEAIGVGFEGLLVPLVIRCSLLRAVVNLCFFYVEFH